MKSETRVKFDQYLRQIETLNGTPSAEKKFTVTPSVQQTLENTMVEMSDFLQSINVVGVDEQSGEAIGLGPSGPIASTTNTATTDRAPVDPKSLTSNPYECTQTNFDTLIKYSTLDQWAKFPDFQIRLRNAVLQQMALDRIMIGFNGTSRAATSNKGSNPLLQDVNIGWLQKYRDNASARVMDEGDHAGAVRVGDASGRDYYNLDALVVDAVNNLVDPWYRERTDLVVVCGRSLMADKYFPLVNVVSSSRPPSEDLASQLVMSQVRLGNLQAVRVPYFPDNKLMITVLRNLSLYYQIGARRRTIVDNAKRDQIENYESSNEAYVVEDYGAGCVVENIVYTWS